MWRLFVGGLPPGVTPDDLRQRFLPFGEVTECSIAPAKSYGPGVVFPRNFGHVELQPKDEAALRKCIAAYNGCKWRGSQLKCAPAHPQYADRRRQEQATAAGGTSADEAAHALPPLGPGDRLRLKPSKAATTIEVALGSGRKVQHFPEPPSQQVQLAWESLEAPPASGYLYEQLLQRLAADLPPELLAIVEERRRQGKLLLEARERQLREERAAAGVEIAHEYSEQSQGSSGWELGSDDDAATAAATAAGALASRERRQAAAAAAAGPRGRGAAGARQQRKLEHEQQGMQPGQQREDVQQGQQAAPTVPQRRLRVVDFLQPQDAEQEREEPAAAAQAGAGAAADLSRFDSGSDAEWGAPPAGATRQHLLQSRPASSGQQAMQQQVQVWPLAVARSTREEQEHSQPSGSSGSSGGSELEEWLAGAGDLGGGPAASDAEAGALNGEASSGSSGGSELEEFLATAGGDGASPEAAQEEEEGEGAGCEGKEACSDGGQHVGSGGEARTQPVAAAAADGAGRSTGGQQVRRTSQQPQQQPPQLTQQRGVVAFVEGDEAAASGRQWWHKPIPAVDLSRFASSSDEEGGGRPTALPAAVGGKRGVAHHQGAKKRRQQHMIPQVDGAADSGSDEDSASSDKDDDSESEDASTSGSEGSAGSGSDEGTSGSSTSEDAAGKDQVGEQLQKGGGASGQANAASAGHGNERSGSEGEESEEEAETADDGRAAAAAAAQEQQRQLAALFPEGAAFRRSEPLAQIEATWRVSRESWVQDYRQKHRQAVRMLGRSSGGGGKRQRKG